jgi:DNA-binding CsgD family transcriptional regulator
MAMLDGKDIAKSAATLHLSVNTVRSHLRGIYGKLGVNNQAELLRVLATTMVDY